MRHREAIRKGAMAYISFGSRRGCSPFLRRHRQPRDTEAGLAPKTEPFGYRSAQHSGAMGPVMGSGIHGRMPPCTETMIWLDPIRHRILPPLIAAYTRISWRPAHVALTWLDGGATYQKLPARPVEGPCCWQSAEYDATVFTDEIRRRYPGAFTADEVIPCPGRPASPPAPDEPTPAEPKEVTEPSAHSQGKGDDANSENSYSTGHGWESNYSQGRWQDNHSGNRDWYGHGRGTYWHKNVRGDANGWRSTYSGWADAAAGNWDEAPLDAPRCANDTAQPDPSRPSTSNDGQPCRSHGNVTSNPRPRPIYHRHGGCFVGGRKSPDGDFAGRQFPSNGTSRTPRQEAKRGSDASRHFRGAGQTAPHGNDWPAHHSRRATGAASYIESVGVERRTL